jgi:hypothetical protein
MSDSCSQETAQGCKTDLSGWGRSTEFADSPLTCLPDLKFSYKQHSCTLFWMGSPWMSRSPNKTSSKRTGLIEVKCAFMLSFPLWIFWPRFISCFHSPSLFHVYFIRQFGHFWWCLVWPRWRSERWKTQSEYSSTSRLARKGEQYVENRILDRHVKSVFS